MKKTKTKKATKTKKNYYFDKKHEKAVVDYVEAVTREEKTKLYENLLQPAFDEMVDKIVYTYKFVSLPNIDDLKDECKLHLIMILDKYDPNRGSTAFAYFSVVTKNWFIQKAKKTKKRMQTEVGSEEKIKESLHPNLVTMNPSEENREKREYWEYLLEEIEYWKKLPLKTNELEVLLAIEHLMENIDEIEIFNKKAIYLYMREITGLSTKQIVSCLSKIRKQYRKFKSDWEMGEY